jgi:hypothetical protein
MPLELTPHVEQSKPHSLKTELTTLVTKAAARKAVIERPSSDVHQDAERTGLTLVTDSGAEATGSSGFRRSASQLEKLRRSFWLHREELARWQRGRQCRTRTSKRTGAVKAFWDPPMPHPQYERIALSHEYGIYLPVKSVESFFEEYKKEVRRDIKAGHFPTDFVRTHCPCPSHNARLPLVCCT